MEEPVRKELETIQRMVLAWEKDYLGWAPPDGDGEFLAHDLLEEIETHVLPYIRRMYECAYLTQSEVREFMEFCYGRVESLRRSLSEMESERQHVKGG